MNPKKIVILGAGESGTGAALLAQAKGYEVFLSDKGTIQPKYKKQLEKNNITYEENAHTELKILEASKIIKSPGIPNTTPIIQKIQQQQIPIISEIEFAMQYSSAKTICITGTNGKTTTTSLIYYLLKNAGLNVGIAGNIGNSLALQVLKHNYDYYVIELSSFQLDNIYQHKPYISILLNITTDHLDRYGNDIGNYIQSKFRITKNLDTNTHFIYNQDDINITTTLKKLPLTTNLYPFSLKQDVEKGAYIQDKKIVVNTNLKLFTMEIQQLALQGKHNIYNSMAAGIAARILDIKDELIRESLRTFTNIDHRMQKVLQIGGIQFVNDSKATNINSVWYALECTHKPIVWIAGGTDKGNDYTTLKKLVKDKVKALVCLGKDNTKLKKAFRGVISNIQETQSMQQAVECAYDIAKKGDTVLLSPACASFDLFKNYEDRGEQFIERVRNL